MGKIGGVQKYIAQAMAMFIVIVFSGVSQAADRHSGYYYPEPKTKETYQAPLPVFQGVSRLSRVGFVTGLDQQQKQRPYPPAYHMFAKGADAPKLSMPKRKPLRPV